MSDPVLVARARLAGLTRHRAPDDPEVVATRRTLETELLARHIRQVVDAMPPPTEQQRTRLALMLLRGGAEAGAS